MMITNITERIQRLLIYQTMNNWNINCSYYQMTWSH